MFSRTRVAQACARVLLPVAEKGSRVTDARAMDPPIHDWHTTGTALVIDDDDSVRELASDILRRAGMVVLMAADGHEGAKLFEQHAKAIRLVLLDRTMPTTSGANTFEQIRALEPNAKVILMSGYSEEQATADMAAGLAGFLMKPFDPGTLLSRVREALGNAASP